MPEENSHARSEIRFPSGKSSPPAITNLLLDRLIIRQVRCIAALDLAFDTAGALFIGDNAQGKTTLLESICVLLRLRSPRSPKLSELVSRNHSGLRILGRCHAHELDVLYSGTEKRLLLDGNPPASISEYLRTGLVTWIGNDDLNILRGGSEQRRTFLDFICAQLDPNYPPVLRSFQQALRQRNAALRAPRIDWKIIEGFDALIAPAADLIRSSRERLITQLAPLAASHHTRLSAGAELLEMTYRPSTNEPYAAVLRTVRCSDERLRTSTTGPHRDSLTLLLNGQPAHTFASEGQQRSAVLSLKLAQFELISAVRGVAPIVLIDDVFGELDAKRRNAVMAALPGAQRFITTTSLRWIDDLPQDLPVMKIRDGQIES